jgi:hypothetical protein
VSCGYGEPVGGNTEVFGPSVIIRMEAEAWGDLIDNYLRAASHLLDHGGFREAGFLIRTIWAIRNNQNTIEAWRMNQYLSSAVYYETQIKTQRCVPARHRIFIIRRYRLQSTGWIGESSGE